MTKNTIFHLARHGQTEWNVEQRIQGQLDSPLTARGLQQALHLAKICQPLHISQILTSPLGRTYHTAEICAQHLQIPLKIVTGIEERNFGLWQGKKTLRMQSHPDYIEITSQVTDCKPQQGESAKQLLLRFENALKQQFEQAPDEHYLVITHGEALRCFMSQFIQTERTTTGYDYHNGQQISICFEHTTGHFYPL